MLMPGVTGIFAILGIVALFSPIQSVVNILASVQGLWWLIAAIILLVRTGKVYDTASMNK
jgi:hypothetical protein